MTLRLTPTAGHDFTDEGGATRVAPNEGYTDGPRSLSRTVLWCAVALLAACAALLFGGWLKGSPAATGFEQGIVSSVMQAAPPVVAAAHVFAAVFAVPSAIVMLVAVLVLLWLLTRSLAAVLRQIVAMGVPLAFVMAAKLIVARPRPVTAVGLGLSDWSFPSGHTACAVVVTLSLIALIRVWQRGCGQHRALANGLCLALPLIALATAYSRLVLGVHFPSDVLTSLIVCPLLYVAAGSVVRWYRPSATKAPGRRTAA